MSKADKYKNEIARKHKVNPKFIEYIGMQDYGDFGILYYYNINDPKHPDYKSTKVVKENMDIIQRLNILIQENVSDGIQAELERRKDRIKKDLDYIKKIVRKLSRWAGANDIESDVLGAEEKLDRAIKKTDGVLDDMFDDFNTNGLRR